MFCLFVFFVRIVDGAAVCFFGGFGMIWNGRGNKNKQTLGDACCPGAFGWQGFFWRGVFPQVKKVQIAR